MSEPVRRLFLALWPDAAVRGTLATVQQRIGAECGGRAILPENLHVTLKFLGAVPQSGMQAVREVAAGAPRTRADLLLDRIGFWPRPAIVFAGADSVPEPIRGLVEYLETGFAGLGFARERRRFHVHCTLFRKARRRPGQPFEPIHWPVDGFALVVSELSPAGARYRVLETLPAPTPTRG